jgi:hypothetical protein
MKAGQKLWTKEELILAVNLYCKLPFGRLHHRNPEIIDLASLIGRTPEFFGSQTCQLQQSQIIKRIS